VTGKSAPKVVVIGAGSIGAHIAYRLAARGCDVTVLDAGSPGSGTTARSIAGLSTFPQVAGSIPAMVRRRMRTNDLYRELQQEVGGSWLHWTGTLTWSDQEPSQSRLRQDFASMAQLTADVEALSSTEASDLDPAIRFPTGPTIYRESDGGWIDGPGMVASLLGAAVALGADVHQNSPVTAIAADGDGVRVSCADTEYVADVAVNAAGSWASHVGSLAGAAIPLDLRPGLIVLSDPLQTPLRHVINSTQMNIRPDPTGCVAIHWRGDDTYTAHGFNAAIAQHALDAAAEVLPELGGSVPLATRVGIRPVPPGGPIVGWHPSVQRMFLAISHGGIGWGPEWAQAAADAIIEKREHMENEAFSPNRFFHGQHSWLAPAL